MIRAVSGWKQCYPMGAELRRQRSSSAALTSWRGILEGLPSPSARQKPSSTLSEPPVSTGFRMLSGCAETRTEEEAPMPSSSTSTSSMSPSVPTFSGDKMRIFLQTPLRFILYPLKEMRCYPSYLRDMLIICKDANGFFRKIEFVEQHKRYTLYPCDMRDDDTPIVLPKPSLLLNVFCFELGEDITMVIHWYDSLWNLKRKIRDEINIPLEKQFLYSGDGKLMENDEKLLLDYGILNQQASPYGAIRIYLCMDQRGMIACGTFSMAFACKAGVFLCCDSQSSYLVKRENDKKITYVQVKDNIEKMTLVDENIAFVMAGDTRKFPLLRAVVAKVHRCLQHIHKEFTLEDITSAMHAEISPNPDVFVGVTAIFADRRLSAYNIVKWKVKTTVSVPESRFRSAAIGSGAFHGKLILWTESFNLSYTEGEGTCCRAGHRALDMDKTCGGRFRVFSANKNQPWSAQPNAEFPLATLTEMIIVPWGFSDRPSIGNFFDDGRNERINDDVWQQCADNVLLP